MHSIRNTGLLKCSHHALLSFRYLGSGCTTMAVVELELPTGYEACESLENNFSDWRCLSTVGDSF